MKISDRGIDLIKGFEDYARKRPDGTCEAYREVVNGKLDVPTIGWGCTEGVTMGLVWTRQEAEDALRRELAKHEAAVNRAVTVEINQNEFDALVSFSYNVGAAGMAGSTVLKRLNKGDHKGAADALELWNKVHGKPAKALIFRRSREKAFFLKPTERDESMPQTVAEAPPPLSKRIVAAVGAAGGGLASQLPSTLAPPDHVTNTVNQLSAWQGLASSGKGLFDFALHNWWAVLVMAGVAGGLTLISRARS